MIKLCICVFFLQNALSKNSLNTCNIFLNPSFRRPRRSFFRWCHF